MSDLGYRITVGVILLATMSVRTAYDTSLKTRPVHDRSEQESPEFGMFMGIAIQLIILVQLLGYDPLPWDTATLAGSLVRDFGVAFEAIGALFMTWPRVMADRKQTWSSPITTPDNVPEHRLVTWGPYRYIRHPCYLGIILGIVGVELGVASACIVFIPIFVVYGIGGIRKEERQLETKYGDAYREYRARTWLLVPFIM